MPRRGARRPRAGLVSCVALAGLLSVHFSGFAMAKDDDDDDQPAKPASTLPNIYLDLRTNYATVPANTLSIGLGNQAFVRHASGSHNPDGSSDAAVAADPVIAVKSKHRCRCPADGGSQRSCPAYGGFSGSASKTSTSDWSAFTISSWNVGFQADVYQQNGGSIPTVTLQSTVTRSVPDAPLATTSLNAILEFDYALNKDETRGFLAGVQYTRVAVDSPLATINPNLVGYVGGYYQWDDKLEVFGANHRHVSPWQQFPSGAGQPIADF